MVCCWACVMLPVQGILCMLLGVLCWLVAVVPGDATRCSGWPFKEREGQDTQPSRTDSRKTRRRAP